MEPRFLVYIVLCFNLSSFVLSTNDFLLPSALVPSHYNVRLRPNLYGDPENFELKGSVQIFVNCVQRTTNITLHIKNLQISAGTLYVTKVETNTNLSVLSYTIDTTSLQLLTILMQERLETSKEYYIGMDFSGPLQNSDLTGQFYNEYTSDSETRVMSVSHFIPTHARQAFPCFDEPMLKATFNITLERRPENNVITLSNMPQLETIESSDGHVADIYEKGVRMSTFIVAFAFCEFPYLEKLSNGGTKVRTYAPKDRVSETDFILQKTSELVDIFEEYFGISYPLPKLDVIDSPDLFFLAVENWGLITFYEYYMFTTHGKSTAQTELATAGLLGHKVSQQNCMNNNLFGNIDHDDLFNEWEKALSNDGRNVSVSDKMRNWVHLSNYPVVNVSITDSGIKLTQQRFVEGSDIENYVWEIPLTIATNLNPYFEQDYTNVIWMSDADMNIDLDTTGLEWVVVDIGRYGYYRVNYDEKIYSGIISQLNENHSIIPAVNRAGFFYDTIALHQVNYKTFQDICDLYLHNEDEYLPWIAAMRELKYVETMMYSRPAFPDFKCFMLVKSETNFKKKELKVTPEQPIDKRLLWSSAAEYACKYDHEKCVKKAYSEFLNWKSDTGKNSLFPDVKWTILCTAMSHGTADDWDFLFKTYFDNLEQTSVLKALSCSKDDAILDRFLEYSLNSSIIQPSHAFYVMYYVASQFWTVNVTWNFIDEYATEVEEKIGMGGLISVLLKLTQTFHTAADLDRVEKWKIKHESSQAFEIGLDMAMNNIKSNMEWNQIHYDALAKWMHENFLHDVKCK